MYNTHMHSVFAFFSGVSPDWVGCPIQNHCQITGADFYPSHQPTASKHWRELFWVTDTWAKGCHTLYTGSPTPSATPYNMHVSYKNDTLLKGVWNQIKLSGDLYFKIWSICLCPHLTLYPATDCAAATDYQVSAVIGS